MTAKEFFNCILRGSVGAIIVAIAIACVQNSQLNKSSMSHLYLSFLSEYASLKRVMWDKEDQRKASKDPCAIPGSANQFDCEFGVVTAWEMYQIERNDPRMRRALELSLSPTDGGSSAEVCKRFDPDDEKRFFSFCKEVLKKCEYRKQEKLDKVCDQSG